MSLVQPAFLLRSLLPGAIWRLPASGKVVYLTFDDGPTPGITNEVLDILEVFKAKATFFCLGKNVESYPDLFSSITQKGHRIGNHSYAHPNGWKTPSADYLSDIQHAESFIHSNLFRPPYGRLKPTQFLRLKKKYKIIMWDVLAMDYDIKLSPEKCLDNVLNHTRSGSIITFHDSQKAWPRLKVILPLILNELSNQGYRFEILFTTEVLS